MQHVGDAAYSKCAQQGIAVKPVKGDALLLYNLLENGRNDGESLHQVWPCAVSNTDNKLGESYCMCHMTHQTSAHQHAAS